MPRYMLLIVEDEAPYQSSDKALFDEIMAMHASFSASVREAGAAVLGGDALRGGRPPRTYVTPAPRQW